MIDDQIASKQLEWYRDTVKWLVAIAGGAVLLGTQWAFDERLSGLGRALFTTAAIALLLASGTGILAMFKFADYSDSRSQTDRRGSNKWFWWTFSLTFIGLTTFALVGIQAVWLPPAVKN